MATFIDRIVERIVLAFIIPVLFVTLDFIKIHAQPDIYGTTIPYISGLEYTLVFILIIVGSAGVLEITGVLDIRGFFDRPLGNSYQYDEV